VESKLKSLGKAVNAANRIMGEVAKDELDSFKLEAQNTRWSL